MAHNEPSHQDLHCLPFWSWFTTVNLLAAIDVSKCRGERDYLRNSGFKEISQIWTMFSLKWGNSIVRTLSLWCKQKSLLNNCKHLCGWAVSASDRLMRSRVQILLEGEFSTWLQPLIAKSLSLQPNHHLNKMLNFYRFLGEFSSKTNWFFFFFSPENRLWHFMQICMECQSLFSGRNKTNLMFQNFVCWKFYWAH